MDEQDGRYLLTAEVADLLHVSPKTVSRWAKEGKIQHIRTLGGHRRYPEAVVRQLVEDGTVAAEQGPAVR